MNTENKGQLAVLKAEIRAGELGYLVSKPTIPARYDLLLDSGKNIYRVQVKFAAASGRNCTGSVLARLCRHEKTYSKNEIDVVLVYVPQTDKVYWFGPVHFDGKTAIQIRLEKSRNNQDAKCNLATNHEWNSLV
jgi:hypothetical protein